MASYTGSALYLTFGATVLSADFRSIDVTENITIIDASAGADTWKDKLTGQKDWSATVSLLHQAAGTVLWDALAPGLSGTLNWAPEGTASGKPKHYGVAIVESRSQPIEYEGVVEWSISFVGDGTVTHTIY